MLCLACGAAVDDESECPLCGKKLVPASSENVREFVQRAVRAHIRDWQKDGVVDDSQSERMLDVMIASAKAERGKVQEARAKRKRAEAEERRREQEEARKQQEDARRAAEEEAKRQAEQAAAEDEDDDDGEQAVPQSGAVEGALDVFTSLDTQRKPSNVWPLVYENIGWLIGAVFILAGSIYGVGEAWVTFSPAGRYATVAAAFFVYHASFLGLGALLAKKAPRAARVLAGISATLVPIVAVALGNLVAADRVLGAVAVAVFVAAASLTLWRSGILFGVGTLLAQAMLPQAVLSIALPSLDNAHIARFVLPIIGLLPPFFAARSATLAPLGFGLFGSVALELLALRSSAPDALSDAWRTGGGLFFAWLCLWMAALSLLMSAIASRSAERWPRVSLSAAALGSALGLSASLGAWIDSSNGGWQSGIISFVTALVAFAAHLLGRMRFGALRHMLAPLAALAAYFFARDVFVEQTLWQLDAAAAAGAALLATRLFGDDRKLLRSQAVTLLAVLVVLAFSQGNDGLLGPTEHLLAWSIALGILATDGLSLFALALASASVWSIDLLARPQLGMIVLAALALGASLLRTARDRSGLVWAVALGNWILAFVVGRFAQGRGAWALDLGVFALTSALLAALMRVGSKPELRGTLLGRLGRTVITPIRFAFADGFALTALAAATLVVFLDIAWLSDRAEPDRVRHIESVAMVAATLAAGFFSRGFQRFDMRGRVSLLAATGVVIALAAVTNRIGRPLPPKVVALNLSLGLIALWGVAVACKRYGPAIGRWLGAPDDGPFYHWVLHAGVMALSALLLVDVLLLDPSTQLRALRVVPPLMLIGPAIGALLMARSLGWVVLWAPATVLLVLGIGLAAANGILGVPLDPLVAPGSQWVPSFATGFAKLSDFYLSNLYLQPNELPRPALGNALIGAAAAMAALMLVTFSLERSLPARQRVARLLLGSDNDVRRRLWMQCLELGVFVTMCGLCGYAFWSSSELAAALLCAFVVPLALRSKQFRVLVPLGVATAVHAFAQSGSAIPAWAGIGLAGVNLSVQSRVAIRKDMRRDEAIVAGVFAVLLSAASLAYALATGVAPTALSEGAGVLSGMATFTNQAFWTSAVSALLSGIAAEGAAVAFMRTGGAQGIITAFNLLGAALLALATGFAAGHAFARDPTLATRGTVQAALGIAAWAAAHHVAGLALRHRFKTAMLHGVAQAREALSLLAALVLLVHASNSPGTRAALPLGLGAIAIIGATALHAAWTQKTAWHVYVVHSCITGAYAWIRWSMGQTLSPSVDALFAFGFAFVLVGVMVLLQRAGAERAAEASKRFAAGLPILGALVFPALRADVDTALVSAAAAALYTLLGWASNSRAIGALGAAGANLALLLLTLAEGVTGVEVYLAPLGLLLGMLVHLFAKDTPKEVRLTLRFAASLLVFTPAALKLLLQIGNAQNDRYAVGFGVACLFGVGLGMLLHIRAYLGFGLFFLLLDIGTVLTRASLRNRGLGFFVLSFAGLSILGGMVFVTTQREWVRRVWGRLKGRLRRWE